MGDAQRYPIVKSKIQHHAGECAVQNPSRLKTKPMCSGYYQQEISSSIKLEAALQIL